ncbi:MAG: hypothetical protein KAQ92_01525, partial [Candidatus Aenigmarchaeota archaeon]|nr:hypothetical protein [Candidatus Aenigmarchaeota archaeon]
MKKTNKFFNEKYSKNFMKVSKVPCELYSSYTIKKAISPLIASVLLLTFTLTIGIFVSSWFQEVAKTQTESAIAGARPECTYANIAINEANFTNRNSSVNGNFTMTFYAENTGGN